MRIKLLVFLSIIFLQCLFCSCSKEQIATSSRYANPILIEEPDSFIRGIDISSLPEIETGSTVFYSSVGLEKDVLTILKERGVNTIRIRLWKDPSTAHSGFNEVKLFSQRIHQKGMKVWLTVHYSDTWADPAHQQIPLVWSSLSYPQLKDSVYRYTSQIMDEIKPDFIQLGNEINPGIMLPVGDIASHPIQFLDLLSTCSDAVRDHSTQTLIVIHYAGLLNSEWFFNQVDSIDYDIIGLSYYPIWHGKDLISLQSILNTLVQSHQKDIVIAETAYPFTLNWNDWTNNVIGDTSQLIIPEFPASPDGQKQFVQRIRQIIENTHRGKGFLYWGGELVSTHGPQATNGSTWENQAVFDFTNRELPVLQSFSR